MLPDVSIANITVSKRPGNNNTARGRANENITRLIPHSINNA
jgi:hypothetical protein